MKRIAFPLLLLAAVSLGACSEDSGTEPDPEPQYFEWGENGARNTMGSNSRVRAVRARSELGWHPHAPSLIDEIQKGCYATAE